ncbi:hypothetical protein C7974DRAFT_380502 [Boeremia exigua]|uniref:uncharacterized protein n=1 Tax=Boeremia exigua TaxID=749465 RepID=UPI001E8EB848|nr:uncharacterized protein C7974DRAFT_380502 [Boeremia exigua]KAH6614134.1 hypothetical protein C7974DRAFT_380502 [Boeremia exigua]
MFTTDESLQDIDRWARNSFPDEFDKLKGFLHQNNVTAAEYRFRVKPSETSSGPPRHYIWGVIVGVTGEQNLPVYASLSCSKGYLLLYHEPQEPIQPDTPTQRFMPSGREVYMVKHDDCSVPTTRFKEPFNWLHPAEDEVGATRLEALVQYIVLANIERKRSVRVDRFKENFEGACRDIAESLARQAREQATASRSIILKFKALPPPAAAAQSLPETSVLAALPSQPRTIEEIFGSFKSDLEDHVNATQASERRETESLRAENKALKEQVEAANEAARKAEEQARRAEEASRKAQEEATKSKAQYEGLRRVVQKTKSHYEELSKVLDGDVEMEDAA